MRKTFFIIICLFLTSYIQSQEKYYYAFDEKTFLNEVPNKFVLSYDKHYFSDIQAYLQRKEQIHQIELINNLCILTTTENSDIKIISDDFKKQIGVKSVNPVYILADYISGEMYTTEKIVVQFKDSVSQNVIDEMHKKYRIEILEITERFQVLSVPIEFDPLDVANDYQTSGLTNFSNPSFISKIETHQYYPSDPYFINQYSLHNTGQTVNGRTCKAGAHINVLKAWNETLGNSNIVIAVLDEGVTSNHPDLPNTRQIRLSNSNRCVEPDRPANNPSPTGNMAHGDASAGLIAASHNNEGIAGIAPNCKIMPIRIFYSKSVWPATPQILDPFEIAAAITYAKNSGADIISCSWSYGDSSNPNKYPEIVDAISNATITGRNGKGCLFSISAGNNANYVTNPSNPGYIKFPSNVKVPGVLTVGASDRNDFLANYSPQSKYLHESDNQFIDVVAPSHKAYSQQISGETWDVWTIDKPGTSGYNKVNETDGQYSTVPTLHSYLPDSGTNYDAYTGHHGGTSASAAIVSGVAALVLSVNPNLTQLEVSKIIKQTARYIGGNNNSWILPDGRWCRSTGYGVVDAYRAVEKAIGTVSGPSEMNLCSITTFTFSSSLSPGYSLHWRATNGLVILSGENSNTVTVQILSNLQNTDNYLYLDIVKPNEFNYTLSNLVVCKTNTSYDNLYTTNTNITSNTTWSGQKALGVKVTVATGKTLTITGTVYCTQNA